MGGKIEDLRWIYIHEGSKRKWMEINKQINK